MLIRIAELSFSRLGMLGEEIKLETVVGSDNLI
jgi:hypothetical protein